MRYTRYGERDESAGVVETSLRWVQVWSAECRTADNLQAKWRKLGAVVSLSPTRRRKLKKKKKIRTLGSHTHKNPRICVDYLVFSFVPRLSAFESLLLVCIAL